MPALEYLSKNHKSALGFKNFTVMKNMFGPQAYQACCAAVSVSVCNSLPAATDDEIIDQNLVSDLTDSV